MKRFNLKVRDDGGEAAGELTDSGRWTPHEAPSERQKNGVGARAEHLFPNWHASLSAIDDPCRSFEDIYVRYKRYVWTKIQRPWIRESEAKDIFQKVFLTMHQWTHEKGMPQNVAPVLLAMIGHQICNHLRERERCERRINGEVEADTLPSSKPDPEQLFGRAEGHDEATQTVNAILARMPADAARVLRLIEIGELSHEQAARLLDRPVGTLRVQLHRARARFWELAVRLHKMHPRAPHRTQSTAGSIHLAAGERDGLDRAPDTSTSLPRVTRKGAGVR